MSVSLPYGATISLLDLFASDFQILKHWRKTLKASRQGKRPLSIHLDDKFLYLNDFISKNLYNPNLNLELMRAIENWDSKQESDKEPYRTKARYINNIRSPYDVYTHTIYSDALSVMQENGRCPDHSRVEKLILQSWKKLEAVERGIFERQYAEILEYKRLLIPIELLSDSEFDQNPDIVHRFFSSTSNRFGYMRPGRVCAPYYFLAYDRGYVDSPRSMNTQYILVKQVRDEYNLLPNEYKNSYIEAHVLDKLRFEIEVHKFYCLELMQMMESRVSIRELYDKEDCMRIEVFKTLPEKFTCFVDILPKKFVNRVKEGVKGKYGSLDSKDNIRNFIAIGGEVFKQTVMECMGSADSRSTTGRYWTFYCFLEKDFRLDVKILISSPYILTPWKSAREDFEGRIASSKRDWKYPSNTFQVFSHHYIIRFYHIDELQLFSKPTNLLRATFRSHDSDSEDSLESPCERPISWFLAPEEDYILK